jgi:hypothetical protein
MELKCFVCNAEGTDNVYVKVVSEGEEKLACVRCLPQLIHGSH